MMMMMNDYCDKLRCRNVLLYAAQMYVGGVFVVVAVVVDAEGRSRGYIMAKNGLHC